MIRYLFFMAFVASLCSCSKLHDCECISKDQPPTSNFLYDMEEDCAEFEGPNIECRELN